VDGLLKQASLYWSWGTTPTEDAKASSAFFHTVGFTGAYGVSHFSSNTLRVLTCAVTPERGAFVHLRSLAERREWFPPCAPIVGLENTRKTGFL